MTPAVSVVIPTYNGAAFVAEALDSVYRQTLRPCEVVIVDDCSVDETQSIIAEIARTAPVPTRLINRRENSGGPARPLNQGIAAATGDLIAILDQDDVFLPTKLQDQVDCLTRDPSLAFAFSLCGDYDRPDQVLNFSRVALSRLTEGAARIPALRLQGAEFFRLLLKSGNIIMGYPAVVFRRAAWQRKGGLDESLTIASDYEFFCGLCLQADVAFIDKVHYLRRQHAANLCNHWEPTRMEAYMVQARYLAQQPWILEDAELSATVKQNLFDLAYLLRQRGCYREAWRNYRLSLRCWGWEGRILRAMAKLLPHWALAG
jgi:glycosyltransferase involved in cell wall biosynthesis